MSGETQRDTPEVLLTGRGAVVAMLVVFALGLISATSLGWPVLVGVSFIVGSATAVFYVRTRDLLVVTAAPPLLFGIVLVAVKTATATGSLALSTAEGAAITLAGVAPWLFAGMALSLVIAWRRGLRGCFVELREDLRSADYRPRSVAGPGPSPAAQEEPSPPLAAPGNSQSGPAA